MPLGPSTKGILDDDAGSQNFVYHLQSISKSPWLAASSNKRLTIVLLSAGYIILSLNVSFPSQLDSISYRKAGDDEFSMKLASLSISDDFDNQHTPLRSPELRK